MRVGKTRLPRQISLFFQVIFYPSEMLVISSIPFLYGWFTLIRDEFIPRDIAVKLRLGGLFNIITWYWWVILGLILWGMIIVWEAAKKLGSLEGKSELISPFEEVRKIMPELIAEMKEDLMRDKVIREFFISSKGWALNIRSNCFIHYIEDHIDLESIIQVLENYSIVIDITSTNLKRYRMTEEFVESILSSKP